MDTPSATITTQLYTLMENLAESSMSVLNETGFEVSKAQCQFSIGHATATLEVLSQLAKLMKDCYHRATLDPREG